MSDHPIRVLVGPYTATNGGVYATNDTFFLNDTQFTATPGADFGAKIQALTPVDSVFDASPNATQLIAAEAAVRIAADETTTTALDAFSAELFNATPYNVVEVVPAGQQRVYAGSVWQANVDVPAGLAPLGVGDGSLADQLLLTSRASGFAYWVTGGQGKTVFTVHNENDTGAGSLRQTILDAQAANGGWIVFDPTFNGGAGAGKYKIVCTSDYLQIAGPGAWDITIDGRGCDVTVDAGGAPGLKASPADPNYPGATVGTPGFGFIIGGNVYADFNRSGNTTPAHNIIVHNIKFISNFGGEESRPQDLTTRRVVSMVFWCRGIWFDHCSFTNPNRDTSIGGTYSGRRYIGGTDGLFEGDYGATEITVSWCHLYEHYKAWIIIDTVPPISQAPSKLAPGVSSGSPGPYELDTSPNTEGGASSPQTGDVVNLVKYSIHHNHFEHIDDRQPYVKGFATRAHLWNNHHDQWGNYTPDANVSAVGWPDLVTDGTPANQGSATRMGHLAQVVEENSVFTPYPDGLRGGLIALHTTDGSVGNLRTAGNLLEPLTSGACVTDADRGTSFDPNGYYSYLPETADANLKTRIASGAGAVNGLWTHLGPGTVRTSIDVTHAGAELGAGSSAVAAAKLDFVGTAFDSVVWDGTSKVTVTATAGAVDPTTILLVGTSLPAAGVSYVAKRFRVVNSLDAPTTGTEYECRHNTGLNVYEWQQVAGAVVPPVVVGQQLADVFYNPTGAQTAATTTSTTAVDITAAAITASWTGVSAATFDLTFTVPPSRRVRVTYSMLANMASAGQLLQGALYDVSGAANVTGTSFQYSTVAGVGRVFYEVILDSATLPAIGASFTVRPRWMVGSGTGTVKVGGVNGPFIARVVAA